jgi:hypothetical protein
MVPASHLTIGKKKYPLKAVTIWIEPCKTDAQHAVEINLLADSEDPTTSGFATTPHWGEESISAKHTHLKAR